MRCSCCNKILNDFEATLKHRHTGEYLDTCTTCLKDLNIPSKGRADLRPKMRLSGSEYYESIMNFEDIDDET